MSQEAGSAVRVSLSTIPVSRKVQAGTLWKTGAWVSLQEGKPNERRWPADATNSCTRKLYHGYLGPAETNSWTGEKSLERSLIPLKMAVKEKIRMALPKNPTSEIMKLPPFTHKMGKGEDSGNRDGDKVCNCVMHAILLLHYAWYFSA